MHDAVSLFLKYKHVDGWQDAFVIIQRQHISISVYLRAVIRHVYPVVWKKKRQIGGLVVSSLS